MRDSKFHLNGLYFEKDLIHFELFSFAIKKTAAFRFIKNSDWSSENIYHYFKII